MFHAAFGLFGRLFFFEIGNGGRRPKLRMDDGPQA
jgi:hypothetical protein